MAAAFANLSAENDLGIKKSQSSFESPPKAKVRLNSISVSSGKKGNI